MELLERTFSPKKVPRLFSSVPSFLLGELSHKDAITGAMAATL